MTRGPVARSSCPSDEEQADSGKHYARGAVGNVWLGLVRYKSAHHMLTWNLLFSFYAIYAHHTAFTLIPSISLISSVLLARTDGTGRGDRERGGDDSRDDGCVYS